MRRAPVAHTLLAAALALGTPGAPVQAQWVTTYESFYLQAPHNWTFRRDYSAADRLFNAFDYGHAILYETLLRRPGAPASELEERIYDRLTKEILVRPPKVPLEELAIEPMYARLAPEAKAMFDWSHVLHRQIYDVLADERLDAAAKDAEVARLIAFYKTRPDLAFSSKPKSMELMQEQPYSLAFRQKYPKFNGLIWAYHWFQVGLYEPLLVGTSQAERQAGVRRTVARFWQMLTDAPRTLPYQMPMTSAISPAFAARYPEAAIIFDNLHSMHDVVSDILANPSVPANRKRAEIMLAARRFRDDTSYVMPVPAWLTMSREMGVENMGGPAVGFAAELPTPTVTAGAVMLHDRGTGRMTGMKVGSMTGAHAGMSHEPAAAAGAVDHSAMDHAAMGHVAAPASAAPAPAAASSAPAADPHAGHVMPTSADSVARASVDTVSAPSLARRLLADPVIRRRVMADTALRRMVLDEAATMAEPERSKVRALLAPVPARR